MDGTMKARQRLEKILLHKDNKTLNRAIELSEIDAIIDNNQTYYILHKQAISANGDRLEHIQGQKLLRFLKDYIEPESGDGLDIDVFPEAMHWHLSFTIDGLILYSEQASVASPKNNKS
jgi:hypothetical protein